MMLKENGDKRLSEHHSIYQNSVHEIATSENLKCLFIQAQEPPGSEHPCTNNSGGGINTFARLYYRSPISAAS